MATATNHSPSSSVDPKSGFCYKTKTYQSLRPKIPLPPPSQPLSITDYTLSQLLNSPTPISNKAVLIEATTGRRVSYGEFLSQVHSLTSSLQTRFPSLSKGHVAFILAPTSVHVPVLYFSLMALGVTISPANPTGSDSDVAHQVRLCNPVVSFATSATVKKLNRLNIPLGTVLLDSPEFDSMINAQVASTHRRVEIAQSDSAAILYSSGTTGRVKGVILTHRNLIALIGGFVQLRNFGDPDPNEPEPVSFFTLPLFHVFGFMMAVRAVASAETMVIVERFDFETMLRAVEKYRATYIPVSPPLVVALVKSDLAKKYDLGSLRMLACGGAPLGKEVTLKFNAKFPNTEIVQGYGLTETGGAATRALGPEEILQYGSAGRLAENMEAKIVDPETGEALPPGQRGELWLRGPTVMKGYVGDDKATAETFASEGWLKTGDLCYFDSEGFLFIVDRLKELIKYKGYQVPPVELEHLLHSHPEIADAAVIPYPDEEAGQIPMAFVVRKPGSNVTEAQVIDFIAKQVAPYKKVRRVSFINSIPKNPSGKILRRELVALVLPAGASRL